MTKLATDTQVLSVRLPGDLYRAVQQVARREERPMSWLVRKVLEGWLRDDREDGMQP
jgi:predicted transcriptional regulator